MRNPASYVAVTAALALLATACSDASPADVEAFAAPVFSMAGGMDAQNFRAHAHGEEEVPEVESRAQGEAVFKLSDDGRSLEYRLVVANIEDVLMAHIHEAPAGEVGPIVAWLYPAAPPAELIPGRSQGVLAEGVVTADDLMGPLEGADLEALVADLRAGNGYVNVHTTANPAGEVRGQIR